jgi:hypothetical protein
MSLSGAEELQLDHLHHLTALANAHAPLARTASISVFGVQTDAVGAEFGQFGPEPPLRRATVRRDMVCSSGREAAIDTLQNSAKLPLYVELNR